MLLLMPNSIQSAVWVTHAPSLLLYRYPETCSSTLPSKAVNHPSTWRNRDLDWIGSEKKAGVHLNSEAQHHRRPIRCCRGEVEANGARTPPESRLHRWVRGEHLLLSPAGGDCGIIVAGEGGTCRRKETQTPCLRMGHMAAAAAARTAS